MAADKTTTRHLAAAFLALALPVAGWAQSDAPAEPWEDGLTVRAPVSWGVSTQVATVFGLDDVVFGDLQIGGPLWVSRRGGVMFGVVGELRTTSVFTSDGRSPSAVQGAGLDLWLGFHGTRRRSHHAVVARWRQPGQYDGIGWYQLSPAETGVRLGLVYDGYADLEVVHLSMEARIGVSSSLLADLTGSVSVLVPVGERFALGAGVTAGVHAMVTPLLSARARPWNGVELGLGAALPRSLDGSVVHPYPTLDLKITSPR